MTVKEKVYKLTLTLNRESDKVSDIDRNSHVQFSEGDSYKKIKVIMKEAVTATVTKAVTLKVTETFTVTLIMTMTMAVTESGKVS